MTCNVSLRQGKLVATLGSFLPLVGSKLRQMSTSNPEPYDTSQIQVLSSVQAVRKRPGMYVGDDRDGAAITTMLLEVVGNALDQFLAGLATHIDVQILVDGAISVSDDGVGIAIRQSSGKPFIERVLTELHCGPTADGHRLHEHLGPRGIGLAPVNFLSAYCHVTTHRDGRAWRIRLVQGVVQSGLEDLGASTERGTTVVFLPDASVIDCSWIDVGAISRRLQELSWLNPGLRTSFGDQRKQVFYQPDGLLAHFQHRFPKLTQPLFSMQARQAEIEVRICAGLPANRWDIEIRSYVNTMETTAHGVHLDGFVQGFVDALLETLPSKLTAKAVTASLKQKLAAIILVQLRDPHYGEPTTQRLLNPGVLVIVRELTKTAARVFLLAHPAFADDIVERKKS